jgi:serine/threonine-protein kinase
MLAGVRPASGEDAQSVAAKVQRGEVTPLVHAAPDVPRELAGLVHRAMAPSPDLRFASAAEMASALRALASHVGGSTSLAPKPPGAELMPSTVMAPPLGSLAPQPPATRRDGHPPGTQTGPAHRTQPPDPYAAVSPGPPPYGYTPPPPRPSFPEAQRRRKKSPVGWIIGIPLLLGAAAAAVVLAMNEYESRPTPPSIFPPSTVDPTAPPPVVPGWKRSPKM